MKSVERVDPWKAGNANNVYIFNNIGLKHVAESHNLFLKYFAKSTINEISVTLKLLIILSANLAENLLINVSNE